MSACIEVSPVEIQTPAHWNLMGYSVTPASFPHRLRYRPAVFFRQFRPIGALVLARKDLAHVRKILIFQFLNLFKKSCGF
jgi:hypothetical protein